MLAEAAVKASIEALIADTYERMSTPGADPGEVFAHPDIAVAGSGAWAWRYWGGAEPQEQARV